MMAMKEEKCDIGTRLLTSTETISQVQFFNCAFNRNSVKMQILTCRF